MQEELPIPTMAEIERRWIIEALRRTGNGIKAAKLLKVGHTTIYRKMKEYGVKFVAGKLTRVKQV